ncbi:MAG: putative Protochlorophyllide reductase [Marmoricola sp.]|nr:putative Protochlorophyllide reductase [Marmoricola sp.]
MTWGPTDIPDLSEKVALVTGANSGIGLATSLQLARSGAQVVLACRSVERAEAAISSLRAAVPDGRFAILAADLGDLGTLRLAGAEFGSLHERLDILVNNAGIALAPEGRTADGFESHLGANFLGHVALTAQLLPYVLAAPAGRVVHVGSVQHVVGRIDLGDLNFERRRYRGWKAYGQSKLATMLFMRELDRRLRLAGANAISVGAHPGVAGTNIHESYRIAEVRALRPAIDLVVHRVLQDPDHAARPSLMAATAPGIEGGSYYGPSRVLSGPPVRARLAKRARDRDLATRLWTVAEDLTGASFAV